MQGAIALDLDLDMAADADGGAPASANLESAEQVHLTDQVQAQEDMTKETQS